MRDKPDSREHFAGHSWDSATRQVGDGVLSIIMPAHNLGGSIYDNIRRVHELIRGRLPFEIVVIDDGSGDDTRERTREAASKYDEVRPVYLSQNVGKGGALSRGFRASRGSYILLLDADLDLSPEHVMRFFEIMEEQDADVVIGSKRHRDSVLHYPWHRRIASTVYYGIVKMLVGLPVRDTQTGVKLFKREVLEWVIPRMLVKRFAFDLELLAIAHGKGYRVAEAPVKLEFHARIGSLTPTAVKQVMNDTLAIFYRAKILRYYRTIRHTEPPSPPPCVSIVIAYPSHSDCLDECLQAIARQTYENYEVILLPDEDEKTTDHRPQTADHRLQTADRGLDDSRLATRNTRIIPTGELRPAEKRNIGLEHAKGSVVAFLDDDAFPADDWLAHALVYFSDESIAAVGGPGVTPSSDDFMARLSGTVYANRLTSGRARIRYAPTRVQEVEDFPSCNLLVRTEALNSLGGFRTDFWPGEDTILCLEIIEKLGKKIMYDPRVLVYHHRRRLFLPHLRQIGRYALHRGYFARKFPGTSRRLSYMLPSLFVLGLVFGAIASAAFPPLRTPYLAAVLAYTVTTLIGAHRLRNPRAWFLIWLGIVFTHCVYGARFLQGLLSRRMPCEVQAFDHASEGVSRRGAENAEEGVACAGTRKEGPDASQ